MQKNEYQKTSDIIKKLECSKIILVSKNFSIRVYEPKHAKKIDNCDTFKLKVKKIKY